MEADFRCVKTALTSPASLTRTPFLQNRNSVTLKPGVIVMSPYVHPKTQEVVGVHGDEVEYLVL